MSKVRFRAIGGPSPERCSNLLKILCQKDTRIVKLITTYDGYIIITDTDICTNNIYEESTRNALTAAGFFPILSPKKEQE